MQRLPVRVRRPRAGPVQGRGASGALPLVRPGPRRAALPARAAPGELTVEAYLLDFHGDLYGRALTLRLVQRLREEIAFASEAALVRQIEDDVAETRRILPRAIPPERAR